MIHYVINGSNYTMPLTMLMNLGHTTMDRKIASAVLIQNPWLFGVNPGLAMYLKMV